MSLIVISTVVGILASITSCVWDFLQIRAHRNKAATTIQRAYRKWKLKIGAIELAYENNIVPISRNDEAGEINSQGEEIYDKDTKRKDRTFWFLGL